MNSRAQEPIFEDSVAEIRTSAGSKRSWKIVLVGGGSCFVVLILGLVVYAVSLISQGIEQQRVQNELRAQRIAKSMVTVEYADFQKEVFDTDGPVIVNFYADWCPQCRRQDVVLREVAADVDEIKIVSVDVEAERELATNYRVDALPTLLFVNRGQPIARRRGRTERPKIDSLLKSKTLEATPGESEATRLVRESRTAHFNGDNTRATALVEQALKTDANHEDALYYQVKLLASAARDLIRDEPDKALALYDRISPSAHRLQRKSQNLNETDQEMISLLYYDEACAAAKGGQPERAVKCLRDSFAAGFRDLDHYEADSDLDSLRQREDYRLFMAEARRTST